MSGRSTIGRAVISTAPHRWLDTGPVPKISTASDPEKERFGLNEAPTTRLALHRCARCGVQRITVAAQMDRGGSFRGLATVKYLYRQGQGSAVEDRPLCQTLS